MLKGRTLEFLYHPAFLGFILWIAISLAIPANFSKYSMKILSEETIPPGTWIFFSDLDNDGYSERISADIMDSEQTKIIVSKNSKIIDQYNLPLTLSNKNSLVCRDFDNDAFQEIFAVTLGGDAVHLNLIDPIKSRSVLVYNKLIDRWSKPSQSVDRPNYYRILSTDTTKISNGEMSFYISTGFSLQPRNVYRYFYQRDSLIKSPLSYATIIGCTELRNPQNPSDEIYLVSTQATGNTSDTVSYSDQYAWFMVLDKNLQFQFRPVQVGVYPSKTQTVPLAVNETLHYLVLSDYYGTDAISSGFLIFDTLGNKITERSIADIEPNYSGIFANKEDNYNTFYFLRDRESNVDLLDASLNVVSTRLIPEVGTSRPLAQIDADHDGKSEYFFLGGDQRSLIICQHNFKHAISYPFGHIITDINFSLVNRKGSRPLLYMQLEKLGWFASYERNWLYYLKIPYYIFLYSILYVFLALIYHIQKKRLDIKTATEKRIASLQMKAIKNQLDPHFTLNVLNAIGSLYATEGNKDKADYIFGKYARMIRQTVVSSDEIIISLEEEIDFVRNYIEIEKFRSNNSFEYVIDISPGISMATKIPRMLIHSFVENSIKYVIKKRPDGGMLKVILRNSPVDLVITVEDNGPGLIHDGAPSEGTGKGLKLVNELSELYFRLEKVKITTRLENISSTSKTVSGTRATILLPYIIT